MPLIVGYILIIVSIVVGYTGAHGQLILLFQPLEFLIIGGSALGAFIVANPGHIIKKSVSGIVALLKGSRYTKSLYMDLLTLMYAMFNKIRKEGMMAIEDDIENPVESEIFKRFPSVTSDHHAVEFICDYMRLIVSGNMGAHELENLMDIEIDTHHEDAMAPAQAVSTLSDGLPGFGIVAAVLGVVITMSSVGEPPEVLGNHIAAALVGTFLGILLAYGFVGPVAASMQHRAHDEGKFYECIKVLLLASVNGYAPQIAVEFGRKSITHKLRPTFQEMEAHLRENK